MQADQKKRKVEDINARISSKETSKDTSQEIKDLEESIKALNARLQEAKKSQPRPLAKAKVKEKKMYLQQSLVMKDANLLSLDLPRRPVT